MRGHTTENKLSFQPEDKKGKEDTVMCLHMLVHTLLYAPVPRAPTHTDLIAHVCRCVCTGVCVHTFTHPVYPFPQCKCLENQLAAWVCACKALCQAAIAHLVCVRANTRCFSSLPAECPGTCRAYDVRTAALCSWML